MFSPEQRRLKGPHSSLQLLMRGAEEQRWSLSGDQWYNQREQHEVLTGEGQAGYQEKVIYQEGHQVLEQALLGSRHSTELMGTWEVFGQCYRSNGLTFGWSCVEPGVGHDDLYESLPTGDTLWFYAKKIRSLGIWIAYVAEVCFLLHGNASFPVMYEMVLWIDRVL